MKTKILSVLLACLMVVSVLPMSVFAATPACTLVGDKDHTLVNCPDATKIEVVPTVCDKWGYTLYQCPACGDYFADDFVPAQDKHDYSIEVTPAVPATCTKKGKTAVMQCTKCGGTTGGVATDKIDHNWVLTEGNCLAEGVLTCSMCQRTKKVNGTGEGHSWNVIPEIVTKPSCELVDGVIVYTDGVAKYTCSACGDVKNVVIKAAHMKEAMDHVAYKAPTCTEAGNVEYWVCTGCGDENKACGAIFVVDPTDSTKLVEAPKKDGKYDIVIEALGHDFAGQVAHTDPAPVAPTCTEEGSEVKTCNRCGEDITLTIPALGHTADLGGPPYDVVAPTCDRYGYEIWICLVCGEHAKTNVLPMVGHKKPASYVAPDCLNDSVYNCDTCGKVLTEKATGHSTVTVTVPYNCVTHTYTYTYCTNENCPLPLVDKVVVNGVEYDVTIQGTSVTNRLSVHLIGEVVVDVNSGFDTAPDHVYRQTDKELYVEPTCTENGRYVYYCRYCREYAYENYGEGTEPALNHDMIIDTTVGVNGVVAPTCTDYGYTAWKCQRTGCDHTEERSVVPALGHAYDNGVVVYPTCITPGYTLYTCTRCGHVKTENHTSFVPNVEALFYINHVDPTRIISVSHPSAQLAYTYIEGTCEERGLYKYFCPDCGEFLLVVKEGTGEGHTMPAGTVVVPADCLNAGSIASYVCTVCGETVAEKTLPALGHIPGAAATCTEDQVCTRPGCGMVLATATGHDYESIKKLDPTCTEDGHSAYKLCKTCGYENGKTILPKLNHKNIKINVSRITSCELFGFVHYLCPDCDGDADGDLVFGDVEAEYIVGYRNALGHDWKLSDTDSTDMTCESDGENVYYCAHGSACVRDDGTDFGKAWGKKTEVVKASGHQNAAGETIVNDCLDPVVDRVCVNAHCNLIPNADGLRIVGKEHNDVYRVHVEATCVSYAYDLIVCKNCQYNEIDDNSVIPEYGKHCWGDAIDDNDHWVVVKEPTWTEPGLAELRCCYGCEKVLPEPIVHTKPIEKIGIEFTLDMDNAVVSGAGYADSSLVAVKINLNSYKVNVWGVRVNLAYDASIVKYEGYEIVSDTFTVNQAAHDNGGYVTLVANTANTEDKKAQDLPLEGTETFAIVYFRVDNRYATSATFGFVNDAANDKVCEAIMADGTIIDTNINTTVAVADIEKYNESITIEKFLDANADGDVSLEDALALYNAVKGSKYDVVIDTDKDGVITLVDLMNLYNYLVGSMSYEDVTALRG